MEPSEIQHRLNAARSEIVVALRKFYEATQRPIIGSFEVYVHADGRCDYRVTADSQMMFSASDGLNSAEARVRAVEMMLACHSNTQRISGDQIDQTLSDLHNTFEEWRRKPNQFNFDTFAAVAERFGIRPT